jgi:hypothetical protein
MRKLLIFIGKIPGLQSFGDNYDPCSGLER